MATRQQLQELELMIFAERQKKRQLVMAAVVVLRCLAKVGHSSVELNEHS